MGLLALDLVENQCVVNNLEVGDKACSLVDASLFRLEHFLRSKSFRDVLEGVSQVHSVTLIVDYLWSK